MQKMGLSIILTKKLSEKCYPFLAKCMCAPVVTVPQLQRTHNTPANGIYRRQACDVSAATAGGNTIARKLWRWAECVEQQLRERRIHLGGTERGGEAGGECRRGRNQSNDNGATEHDSKLHSMKAHNSSRSQDGEKESQIIMEQNDPSCC
jgi:hypothetical protein